MRLSLVTVILITLFAAFPLTATAQKGFNASELQSQFAQSVTNSVSGVQSANWSTPVDLWVQTPVADKDKARKIAADIVAKSKTDLGQSFCVHVHNGDWKPLSSMCWTYN